jgi:hypothetical protein
MHPPSLPPEDPDRPRSSGTPKDNTESKQLLPRTDPRQWADLIAFLAVLATGVILIIFGHMTVGSLTTACGALVGVYGAWRHFR